LCDRWDWNGVLDHSRRGPELLPDWPRQRHRRRAVEPRAGARDDHSERALQRLAILAGDSDDAARALFDRVDRGRHPAFTHTATTLAEAHRGAGNDVSSLDAIIRELGRAAARARGARYAVHALVAALAWIALMLVIARLTPFEGRALAAAVGIPIVFVIALGAWLLRRPSAAVLMRLADFRLGLKERLSTAWERRSESGPMDAVQLRDALRQASGTRLATAFPVRVNRGEASVVAVLAIFSLALALLPNPMDPGRTTTPETDGPGHAGREQQRAEPCQRPQCNGGREERRPGHQQQPGAGSAIRARPRLAAAKLVAQGSRRAGKGTGEGRTAGA